ncbi:MAG: phosphoketolase family protein, partial [Candidatus Peregrinibacteria bacterium]|nr:phosphoketolase family protein [Candidatus Peregrinibacteria bacterium]
MFCPDELESNKLGAIFEETQRAYMWPVRTTDENIHPDGRAMEMLSEHTLQGWMQGYLLTGRYGIFVSYEAFTQIISSMLDQYAKFLKQSFEVKWRTPIPSAIYFLSSVGWRQDHNGYSHQNPSFVSNVLQKHGDFCQIYYPADANLLIAALEETLQRTDSVSVIVAGKRPLPQWLTLKEARKQAKTGMAIWKWVGGIRGSANPDVVLASAGDYITQEALYAVRLCREVAPELKIRYINVSELTSLCLGDYYPGAACSTDKQFDKMFTKDRPVVFSYHGYTNDIEQILWPYTSSSRFSIHGYREQGSTTTPFDIKVRNQVSCYHLAKDLIEQGAKRNKKIAKKKNKILRTIQNYLDAHHKYIVLHGDDPMDIKRLEW